MSFERPISIKEAVFNVHQRRYILPAIQREFVWEPRQIELLFDSLMRGYPIGSFLFWKVERENVSNYQFYEVIRNYHERDNTHNPKADVAGESDVIAILDGQQRLTALYLSLRGTYASKQPRKRWNNDDAFPSRRLYLNLLAPADDHDAEYDFQFITDRQARFRDSTTFWFRVGQILDFEEPFQLNEFLIDHGLNSAAMEEAKFANRTLFRLQKLIHDEENINYFLEKDESLDKVLNIFIRVNSGGTQLSYSDLLLSIATAQWKEHDAREEITTFVDDINRIGDGFEFSKDLVLKSCLVLSDISEIGFKVDNFNAENMARIEANWASIATAIRLAVTLVASFGYNRLTLTSTNALIPIAYYLHHIGLPENFAVSAQYAIDRQRILKWLILSLLKRAFSGTPDNVLRPIRRILSEHSQDGFPLEQIADALKGTTRSLIFTEEEIDNLLLYKHGQNYTFSTLALLYPTFDLRNKFHIDHIHPRSQFTKRTLRAEGFSDEQIEGYIDSANRLANLQLLEGIPNQEKSSKPFHRWLHEIHPNPAERHLYMERHYIPDTDYRLANFGTFAEKRKVRLKQRFIELLVI